MSRLARNHRATKGAYDAGANVDRHNPGRKDRIRIEARRSVNGLRIVSVGFHRRETETGSDLDNVREFRKDYKTGGAVPGKPSQPYLAENDFSTLGKSRPSSTPNPEPKTSGMVPPGHAGKETRQGEGCPAPRF